MLHEFSPTAYQVVGLSLSNLRLVTLHFLKSMI
jgi:hypothetical protein